NSLFQIRRLTTTKNMHLMRHRNGNEKEQIELLRDNSVDIASPRYDCFNVGSSFWSIFDRIRYVLNKCEIGTLCLYGPCRPESLTDDFLRYLIFNKSYVEVQMLCEGITATGLFAVWEDLRDGIFDGLSIIVGKPLVTELFDLLRTDGRKSSWNEYNMAPIEAGGHRDQAVRYEIWHDPSYDERSLVRMSRIYEGRRWKSSNYSMKGRRK
ncbi:hypothetical protein PFISCL1PPCAC_22317, partial [Pristionchus fissidentatus]